jgi:hypothetical protein
MANARLASLLANRSKSLYNSSGSIRILAPSNSSINSIAKQTASSELDIMVSKYNSGMVSNQEMRAFLAKTLNNPGISATDRLNVDEQLRDFDNKIVGDRLVTAYKSAPDNSAQQVQALQALSSYWKTRAGTMQQDTPAFATASDNAAQYDQKIIDVTDSINKTARQNKRYIAEQGINQIPNNTAENSYARSQMWKSLYEDAVATGDTVVANQYLANYQQELTNAEVRGTKELQDKTVGDIKDEMANLQNLYHDGKISEQQYLDELGRIAPRIDEARDNGLNRTFDRTVDTVQKNLSKGGLNRGVTANGLPFVGKGTKGSGGSTTNYEDEDNDYASDLRMLHQDYANGDIDGKQFLEAYNILIIGGTAADGTSVKGYANQLDERIDSLQALSDSGTKKVGRKTVASLLEEATTERNDIDYQTSALESGDSAAIEIAPKSFNSLGDPIAKPDARPTLKIVKKSELMQNGNWVADETGIYHKVPERKLANFDMETSVVDTASGRMFVDDKGNNLPVRQDDEGNMFVQKGNARAYNPNGSDYYEIQANKRAGITTKELQKEGKTRTPEEEKAYNEVAVAPSYKVSQELSTQDEDLAKAAGMTVKTGEKALKTEADYQKALTAAKEKFAYGLTQKGATGLVDQNIKQVPIPSVQPAKPVNIDMTKSSGLTLDKIQPATPIAPVVQSLKLSPMKNVNSSSAGLTTQVKGLTGNIPSNIKISKAPTVNIGTAIKSGGLTWDKPKAVVKQPSLIDQGINTVKNLATNVFSWFNKKK